MSVGLFFNILFYWLFIFLFLHFFLLVFFLWIYKNSFRINDKISTIHLTLSQSFLFTYVCFKHAYFEGLAKNTYSIFFLYVYCSPFFSMVSLFVVSVTQVNQGPEADDPPDIESEGQQQLNAVSKCLHHSLTPCHHIGILSAHIITRRRVSEVQ